MLVDTARSTQLSAIQSTVSSLKRFHQSGVDIIETAVVVPPDGGWGWITVAASFFVNFLIDGGVYCFGLFLHDISKDLDAEPTEIALANSIMTGLAFFSGPITCAIVNHAGFRITGFLGGVILFIGYFASSFQQSGVAFILILGLIGGFGVSMSYVPSIVVIGFYFSTWRSIATSIAATGSAVGILSFPLIFKHWLSSYHWRTQFMILGSCFLISSFAALTFKPLKPIIVKVKADKKSVPQIVHEIPSIYSRQGMKSTKSNMLSRMFDRYHNVNYPTAAQLNKDSTLVINLTTGSSSSSMFVSDDTLEGNLSIASYNPMESEIASTRADYNSLSRLSTVYENDSAKPTGCCNHKWCRVCCRPHLDRNVVRPMYRDDALYLGPSLLTMPSRGGASSIGPQSQSQKQLYKLKSSVEYHMSVTRGTYRDVDEEERVYCWCCYEHMIRPMVTMLSLRLLRSPSFFVLCLSGFFTMLGIYVPFVYLIEKSKECGIKTETAYLLYTGLGVANGVGRLLCGTLTSIPHLTALNVSYVTILICGLVTFILYFVCNIYGTFICIILYGLTSASLSSLRAPILVDLLGLEALTNSFGLVLLFQGSAAFIGLPIAGAIIQATDHSYKAAFAYSGTAILISAFLLFPVKKISDWEKNKLSVNN